MSFIILESIESSLARLDSVVNTSGLRSKTRTGIGEVLSRVALITDPKNERLLGGYQRVYFHHIRKTAGTSIVSAFYALSGKDPHAVERSLYRQSFTRAGGIRYVGLNAQLIHGGRYFFAVSHFPSYVARPPQDGTFAFTVLRDPVKRVVSLYRYLRSPDSDRGFAFKAPTEDRDLASGTFDEFLDGISPEELLRQLYMFSPTGNVAETVDTLGGLQLVMHSETLDDGISQLQLRTGLGLNIGRERVSVASLEIPQTELDRARELLEDEYEMLRQLDDLQYRLTRG